MFIAGDTGRSGSLGQHLHLDLCSGGKRKVAISLTGFHERMRRKWLHECGDDGQNRRMRTPIFYRLTITVCGNQVSLLVPILTEMKYIPSLRFTPNRHFYKTARKICVENIPPKCVGYDGKGEGWLAVMPAFVFSLALRSLPIVSLPVVSRRSDNDSAMVIISGNEFSLPRREGLTSRFQINRSR
jgi:hypothetical protein